MLLDQYLIIINYITNHSGMDTSCGNYRLIMLINMINANINII